MNEKMIDLLVHNLFTRAALAAATSIPSLRVSPELMQELGDALNGFDITKEAALAKAAFELESTPEGQQVVGDSLVRELLFQIRTQQARFDNAGLPVMTHDEAVAYFQQKDAEMKEAQRQWEELQKQPQAAEQTPEEGAEESATRPG